MSWNRSWVWVSLLFVILGLSSPAKACEPPELTWAKRAGGGSFENAQSVARAGDGWVVCGSYSGVATFGAGEPSQAQLASTGARDAFIAVYGPDGALRWARTTAGGATHTADGLGVAANSSGQVFVTGIFSGSVTFGSVELVSQGIYDSFVASYDANGVLLWARHMTGPGAEDATAVCALGTGSIVVAGRFDQQTTLYGTTSTWTVTSAGQHDAFYAVFTTAGALSFARGEGGAGDEAAGEVTASADGSTFAIAGQMIGATTFGLGHGTTTTFNSSVWSAFVSSYTPSGDLRWVKRVSHSGGGSFGHGLTTLADGSVVATGQVSGSATFGAGEANETTLVTSVFAPNVFLARYGPSGQLAWARRAGGASFAYGMSVCTTGGGDLLVAGAFEGNPVFGEGELRETTLASAGGRDGFVARYSGGGGFLWAHRVGGTQYDDARGVASTGAGDAVVFGTFNGIMSFDSAGQPGTTGLTSAGSSDVFLARYAADSSGFAWARAATAVNGSAFGRGAASMADGSSVVTGDFYGAAVFGAGEAAETTLNSPNLYGAFIARYGADGTLVWARAATGSGPAHGFGVAGHADGSSVVTGYFQGTAVFGAGEPAQTTLSSPGHPGAFIARYGPDGALVWARVATGAEVIGIGVAPHADGSSVVTGYFLSTAVFGAGEAAETTLNSSNYGAFIARYAADGSLLWARAAEGSVFGRGVASMADGSSVVTGDFSGAAVFGAGEAAETTLNSSNLYGAFIARYAADGSLLWARAATSSGGAHGFGVAGHADGSSVVTGYFQGTAVFGAGEPLQTTLSSPGYQGAFVARYAAEGSLVWVRADKGSSDVVGLRVAGHMDGSSVVTGYFYWTAVFGAGEPQETTLLSPNHQGAFIAHYGADGALVWARAVTGAEVAATGVAAHAGGSSVVTGYFFSTAVFGAGEAAETTLNAPSHGAFIARYAGPVSVSGPESVVTECAGDDATEVVFDLQVTGCTDDAVLAVTDVTQGRTLFSGPVAPGTQTIGPNVFPDGLSIVEAEIVRGGTRFAFDSFTVQVGDTTPPVLEGCQPATLELQAPLTTLYKSVLGITATDACDPAPTVSFGPAAVPLGTTEVLVTAEDASGNATTCTIQVTIVDTTAPVFDVAPGDIDRECFGGSVIVNFDILASDLSGTATISCTDENGRTVDPAGTTFEDGVHPVTCVASDSSGNGVTHTFTITVSDNTAPVLVTPDDITVPNETGEAFAFVTFSASATDNCDPSVPIVYSTPSGEVFSGDAFPIGGTVVTCTARDLAGNEATATFQILVRDMEEPAILYSPMQELHTDAAGTTLAITVSDLFLHVDDNWDPSPLVLLTPSILPVGTTTVVVIARDADGNENTVEIEVTVLLAGQETTQAGIDVVVAPETELPDGSTATVTVEFSQVGTGGVTTVTTSENGQPLPNGFKLGNPPIYYDVSTTAQFSGTVELCFTWEEGQIANENNARLFHYENGTWVDVTTSIDTVNNIVCGAVTSLSPFAIVEPSYTFGGILQPIAADGSSIFKRGRVVPVKFQLLNPDGTDAAEAVVRLKIVKISSSVLGTVEEEIDPATVGSANTDNLFRYDATGHQFIYNLATSGLTTGTYRLEILPDDGSRHTVRISIRD